MATRVQRALVERGDHHIGNLNSIKVKTVAHGAIVEGADVDNFTMVELYFNENGERACKQLSDAKKGGYLIASPEELYLGEELVDFYNGIGDRARIVVLESGYTRFDTSAFGLDSTISEIEAGQVAHWDVAEGVFLVHDGSHLDYEGAVNKFLVVHGEEDLEYTAGKKLIRLEVI